ncbi:Methyl-accepting chemotaxis protein [Oleispira antarctica RB-8]|uniref:Methyl-accepting chemotaxis protein n=1 Tax=Oleispira antarctica RB-8 TaxID=698738 RepID=R4YV07_OLEAN|nr:Methyl-accepting chemotaxis protein [Oleispira antarctica RB-8]
MYSIGIKFLNKLSFTRKFQIILFTLFLPILYASVIIYKENSNRIELISNKIIGIETVNKLKPLRILAAKHRGNSAQWFSGNTQLNTTIRSLEQDMVKAFDVVQIEINSPFYSDNSRQAFNQLKKGWNKLKFESIKNESPSKVFMQHSAWVKQTDNLIRDIATQSGLTLDLNIATHKLMEITVFSISQLQEQLGQLRGIGAGAATKGTFNSQSFILASTLANEVTNTAAEIEYEFSILKEISLSYIPNELKQSQESIQKFVQISSKQLLEPDSPTISGKDYFSAGTDAIVQATRLYQAINNIYQNELRKNEEKMVQSMILSLGSFFLLFLISCYLFICLKITVDYNARITQSMAADLEEGRLNQEYHSDSKDELGNTINALKASFSKLRIVVSKVRTHSDTLSHSSNTLSNVSAEVNQLGEDQKNRVALISTAASELAQTAEEVSSHCDHAATKMHESQQQASLGATHSHSSAEVIRTLANNVRSAGDEIGEVAQQAASISTVIDVIKAIAEQTNLLALNAAIEAARAGEQGRGFAVVADEVRTLATRTQESTNEIENTISNLQQVAEKAVLAMATSCDQASQSETEATKTGEILSSIENSINEVSSLIEQVATAGVQQAGAANEIAHNIQAVDDASTTLLTKSQSMSNIANEVGNDSAELDQQMQQFEV